jgi:hypothetical protein
MALNPFYNQPREWLTKQLELVREDLSSGKTLIQWGAGDSSGIRQVLMSPMRRFELIWAELSRIDPDEYPATNKRISRTKARFS